MRTTHATRLFSSLDQTNCLFVALSLPSPSTMLKLPVYIPTEEPGKNLLETQAKSGDLKPFAQRYYFNPNKWLYIEPIGSVFMTFTVIAKRKIWRYFSAIIRLQHVVIFCISVGYRFGLKRSLDLFYFSLNHAIRT